MLPLPYYRYVIDVPEPLERVFERLSDQVVTWREQWRYMLETGDYPRFVGEVNEAGFVIRRSGRYRNPFVTMISGELESVGESTRIHVKMKLHPVGFAFTAVASLLVGLSIAGLTGSYLLVGITWVFVALLIAYAGFWSEASKAIRLLREAVKV